MAAGGERWKQNASPSLPGKQGQVMDEKPKEFEWDKDLSGFGRRTRNSRESWIVQFRLGSKQRRMKIRRLR
jgi:hypothetical protein